MQFRLSTCGRPAAPNVGALREADPRWTDTLYWEGRRELASSLGRAIDFPKVLGLYGAGPRGVSVVADADAGVGERQPDRGGIRSRRCRGSTMCWRCIRRIATR